MLLAERLDRRESASCIEGLAEVSEARGWPDRAARLFGAAQALREAISAPVPSTERQEYDRHVAATRAALSGAAFAGAWAEGRALTWDELLVYVVEDAREPREDA